MVNGQANPSIVPCIRRALENRYAELQAVNLSNQQRSASEQALQGRGQGRLLTPEAGWLPILQRLGSAGQAACTDGTPPSHQTKPHAPTLAGPAGLSCVSLGHRMRSHQRAP